MAHIAKETLLPLDAYARQRNAFRAEVMAHKERRRLPLGPHLTLYFEDELTMRYQVQEMLRAEHIADEAGIEAELGVYNPLVPDGGNFKATMMIEYPDAAARRRALAELKGIEHRVWIQVEGHARVYAIADEDLERETEDKTSSVHFLRFDLDTAMRAALKAGGGLAAGVDHSHYRFTVERIPAQIRASLVEDLA